MLSQSFGSHCRLLALSQTLSQVEGLLALAPGSKDNLQEHGQASPRSLPGVERRQDPEWRKR
jgi:hypothetical protein